MTGQLALTGAPRGRWGARADRATRLVGGAFVAAVAVALLVPAFVVLILSFSNDRFFAFPPESWGLRQYQTLLETPMWSDAAMLSVRLGLLVALAATVIVVPAAFAIHRTRMPWRQTLHAGGVAGLIIPISAYAVAMYGAMAQMGLLGSFTGLLLAHTALGVPMVLIVTSAAMSRLPVELELAAMVAGAGRARAWLGITLRLMIPAIIAGAVLAFITSFDEAVFVIFLGGPGLVTLPKAILESVRVGVDPVVTAVSTLLIVSTSLVLLFATRLARKGQ